MGHAGTDLCHADPPEVMTFLFELVQFIGCSFLWFLHQLA